MTDYPRIIVAGVRGGSGKTTVSLALISALRAQKGLKVTPFKKGPDYIDAGWLSLAAKSPCYNLDPFLISREMVERSFISHFSGDVAVIEGNRGLYDGMDVDGSYSTAEIAKILKAPIILTVDCTKMTRTTAAIVLGCMAFDRDVTIGGVVLNQVGGARHEAIVRGSIEKYCSVPVVGAVPRLRGGEFPERHMGLTPFQEHPDMLKAMSFVERIGKDCLDLDGILSIGREAGPLDNRDAPGAISNESRENHAASASGHGAGATDHAVRIGVVRDSAFQFYYPENIEELEKGGAEVVEISALREDELPRIDALYIGGGFPETHALKLAENDGFRKSVRRAAEAGMPIYGECGGLMFLGEGLLVGDTQYPMVGIFPIVFAMKKRPQAHGYTIVEVEGMNPFYPLGTRLHGHEFHYSAVASFSEREDLVMAFKMDRGEGIRDGKDGLCYKNVLATYTHIHALGSPGWVKGLLKGAGAFKERRSSVPEAQRKNSQE